MKCCVQECVNVGTVENLVPVPLCPTHRVKFQAAAEGKRLSAIGPSLVAEWMERERCEKLNATDATTEGNAS